MAAGPTSPATRPLDAAWAAMTFPAYRHLLPLVGTGTTDAEGAAPVVRIAQLADEPIGLGLATVTVREPAAAAMASLFVAPHVRGHGVGTALVAGLESDLAARGVARLTAVYMTGKPTLPALERIFEKRGFSPPARRTIVVRFTPDEAARTLWYRKARMPDRASMFAWVDLTPAERAEIIRSQAEHPWIHPELEPWGCDLPDFDPVSSVGMRRDGAVVGWVINHRIGSDLVRFTTSFMRGDLARRGAIFPLYVASIERLRGTGVTCTFVTAVNFESMLRFTLRRSAEYVSFCGETRGVFKDLVSSATRED